MCLDGLCFCPLRDSKPNAAKWQTSNHLQDGSHSDTK
nr:hypothetical protein [Tanacetum cinerariifolium]